MTTATVAFALERFQRVPVGDGPSLLRVVGQWHADATVELAPPLLVIDDGHMPRTFAALPGPRSQAPTAAPDGARWQAGFSIPPDLLEVEAAFSLDAGPAGVIGLPAPTDAESGAPAASGNRVAHLERRLAAERHARREVEFDADAHADADIAAQAAAAERGAQILELERGLAVAREQAQAAHADVERARQAAELARADADGLRSNVQRANADAERARGDALAARAEADAAREELAAARAETEDAQRGRLAAEQRAQQAEAEVRGRADAQRLAETRAAAAREAREAAEARAAEAERAAEAAAAPRA
jgi:hypothetical protein